MFYLNLRREFTALRLRLSLSYQLIKSVSPSALRLKIESEKLIVKSLLNTTFRPINFTSQSPISTSRCFSKFHCLMRFHNALQMSAHAAESKFANLGSLKCYKWWTMKKTKFGLIELRWKENKFKFNWNV